MGAAQRTVITNNYEVVGGRVLSKQGQPFGEGGPVVFGGSRYFCAVSEHVRASTTACSWSVAVKKS